jgi:hypothetical protein
VASLLVLGALIFSGCVHHGPDLLAARDRALDHLASLPAGTLAPYVLEAAVAGGRDPDAWPPGHPAAQQVHLPDANGTYQSLLRPAFALSHLPGIPDRDAIYNRVAKGYDGRQFGDAVLQTDDTFALWTLAAIVPDWHLEPWNGMADSLLDNQTTAGGWSWSTTGAADTDTTGMVLSAMAELPGSNASAHLVDHLAAARAFLASAQAAGGGYATQPGGQANCDSTVWGIRGATVAGAPDNGTAWKALLGLQRGDGGFAYLSGDKASNDLCTAEVATLLGDAVAGRIPGPP